MRALLQGHEATKSIHAYLIGDDAVIYKFEVVDTVVLHRECLTFEKFVVLPLVNSGNLISGQCEENCGVVEANNFSNVMDLWESCSRDRYHVCIGSVAKLDGAILKTNNEPGSIWVKTEINDVHFKLMVLRQSLDEGIKVFTKGENS